MNNTTQTLKKSLMAVLSTVIFSSTIAVAQKSADKTASTEANDLSPTKGVIRRDPSDVIKVDDTYYVYYSKMVLADERARTQKTGTRNLWPEGYNADIWVASSKDEGKTWKEIGPMILRGKKGEWDMQSAFTPNVVRFKGKYYLYYTGCGQGFTNRPDSEIDKTAFGLAISKSPTGPFKKLRSPVFETSPDHSKFDSFRIDDAALRIVKGKVWLYYKGRAWKKPPIDTKMGLAIARKPEGPFVRTNNGDPIQSVVSLFVGLPLSAAEKPAPHALADEWEFVGEIVNEPGYHIWG